MALRHLPQAPGALLRGPDGRQAAHQVIRERVAQLPPPTALIPPQPQLGREPRRDARERRDEAPGLLERRLRVRVRGRRDEGVHLRDADPPGLCPPPHRADRLLDAAVVQEEVQDDAVRHPAGQLQHPGARGRDVYPHVQRSIRGRRDPGALHPDVFPRERDLLAGQEPPEDRHVLLHGPQRPLPAHPHPLEGLLPAGYPEHHPVGRQPVQGPGGRRHRPDVPRPHVYRAAAQDYPPGANRGCGDHCQRVPHEHVLPEPRAPVPQGLGQPDELDRQGGLPLLPQEDPRLHTWTASARDIGVSRVHGPSGRDARFHFLSCHETPNNSRRTWNARENSHMMYGTARIHRHPRSPDNIHTISRRLSRNSQ
ncbi:hypothetical protein NAS2_0706 [Conexivisphaera calida]|uniref:Uncharacterized protein n=1 Tax=Conexivisphaera calida TaxID=1874277 RepID=A0A4P2VLV4_9ARCH|nr:hypothetical protein NAS2_0706 [Conexivisphaera calida]